MNSQFIKVSSETKEDYKFLEECRKGDVVKFPNELTVKAIPLKRELYQGEMNYYVMIDKSTCSIAASFANIFQFNNLGIVVGESLDHNSLNFGDIINTNVYQNLMISTVQYNENSKSVNGILAPDIEISYIADEFMELEDPILNRLLNEIDIQS